MSGSNIGIDDEHFEFHEGGQLQGSPNAARFRLFHELGHHSVSVWVGLAELHTRTEEGLVGRNQFFFCERGYCWRVLAVPPGTACQLADRWKTVGEVLDE